MNFFSILAFFVKKKSHRTSFIKKWKDIARQNVTTLIWPVIQRRKYSSWRTTTVTSKQTKTIANAKIPLNFWVKYEISKLLSVLNISIGKGLASVFILLGHPNKMFRFPSPRLLWWWVGRSGKKKKKRWNAWRKKASGYECEKVAISFVISIIHSLIEIKGKDIT